MNIKKLKTDRGFTIVELLIVIVVIAILAAITIVAFNGVQQRARDAERATDVAAIAKAMSTYIADNAGTPIVPITAKEARAALTSYDTVKVDSEAIAKLTGTAGNDPTTYGYTLCTDAGVNTGVTISWVKEADNTTESLNAGTCN